MRKSITVNEMEDQYYLQDSRGYVGNGILWWAKNGAGYTTDVSKAHVFSKDEAIKKNRNRDTDKPWPKSYIDNKTTPVVDMQNARIEVALKGAGIKLYKPKSIKTFIVVSVEDIAGKLDIMNLRAAAKKQLTLDGENLRQKARTKVSENQERVFTEKEILGGYAFREYEQELRAYVSKRYKEIIFSGAQIKIISRSPSYGMGKFTGELLNDAAKALSNADIAIYADHGNLCFGGSLSRSGDHFTGTYNTD